MKNGADCSTERDTTQDIHRSEEEQNGMTEKTKHGDRIDARMGDRNILRLTVLDRGQKTVCKLSAADGLQSPDGEADSAPFIDFALADITLHPAEAEIRNGDTATVRQIEEEIRKRNGGVPVKLEDAALEMYVRWRTADKRTGRPVIFNARWTEQDREKTPKKRHR